MDGTIYGVVWTWIYDGVGFTWEEGESDYSSNTVTLTGGDGVLIIDGSQGFSESAEALAGLYVYYIEWEDPISLTSTNIDWYEIWIDGGVASLDVPGDVETLTIYGGVVSALEVEGDVGALTITGSVNEGCAVHIGGSVGSFYIEGAVSGSLTVDGDITGALTLEMCDEFAGVVEVTGTLEGTNGDIGRLVHGGDYFSGRITAAGDIGEIDVGAVLTGEIIAGGSIEYIEAYGSVSGNITAEGSIGAISAGYAALYGVVQAHGNIGEICLGSLESSAEIVTQVAFTGDITIDPGPAQGTLIGPEFGGDIYVNGDFGGIIISRSSANPGGICIEGNSWGVIIPDPNSPPAWAFYYCQAAEPDGDWPDEEDVPLEGDVDWREFEDPLDDEIYEPDEDPKDDYFYLMDDYEPLSVDWVKAELKDWLQLCENMKKGFEHYVRTNLNDPNPPTWNGTRDEFSGAIRQWAYEQSNWSQKYEDWPLNEAIATFQYSGEGSPRLDYSYLKINDEIYPRISNVVAQGLHEHEKSHVLYEGPAEDPPEGAPDWTDAEKWAMDEINSLEQQIQFYSDTLAPLVEDC